MALRPLFCLFLSGHLRAIPEKKKPGGGGGGGGEEGTFFFTQPPMEFNFLRHQPPM